MSAGQIPLTPDKQLMLLARADWAAVTVMHPLESAHIQCKRQIDRWYAACENVLTEYRGRLHDAQLRQEGAAANDNAPPLLPQQPKSQPKE